MHAGSIKAFMRKPVAKQLLDIGAFTYVLVLDNSGPKCLVKQLFHLDQLKRGEGEESGYDQDIGIDFCRGGVRLSGTPNVLEFIKKSE